MKSNEKQILVLGGTGKTGSRVARRLSERKQVYRIASRNSAIKFDWEDTGTWAATLKDIHTAYISFQPDLAMPGAVQKIDAFVKLCAQSGVKKLVLLSGRREEEAQACEQIVIHSGLAWTIVRASWFNQNFTEGYLAEPIAEGAVYLPAGTVGEPFIDTDDIADVAVAALTEEGHDGQVYDVTGPRLLTFEQAIQEISKATGRTITYQTIPMAAYAAALTEHQLPADIISLITYLFTEVLDGRNENLSDGVERALGRKPTDFSEFARKAAAAGVWSKG
jgi:uncharacterized protein YbjT (DUF2867 family)